ncbi:hypothetical protein GEMRC1_013785 [Eukaryota sp. GEM-RC1]
MTVAPTRRVVHKMFNRYLKPGGQRCLAEWAANCIHCTDEVSTTLDEFGEFLVSYLEYMATGSAEMSDDLEWALMTPLPLSARCPTGVASCSKRNVLRRLQTTYERDFCRPVGLDWFVVNLRDSVVDSLDHLPRMMQQKLKYAGDVLARYGYVF